MSKFESCIICGSKYSLNSKGLCPDCVFKNNHEGKSRTEVYLERQEIKRNNIVNFKVNIIPNSKKKTVKKRSNISRNEKLDKRKEILRKDEETYEQVFNSRPCECEECGAWLPKRFRDDEGEIIARHQYSHIITKGSSPEFRHNPKNFNKLCFLCHHTWEFGGREKMKIYESNQIIIQQLYDGKNGVYN